MENVQQNTYNQLDLYKLALATRNFEIELFWKRSAFFWAFIASAFVGFAALHKDNSGYALIIAVFGLVCSFTWTLTNRGSKYWHEAWEQKLSRLEKSLGNDLFFGIEPEIKGGFLSGRRFSPSKLAIGLSDFTCLVWGLIVFREMTQDLSAINCCFQFLYHTRIIVTLFSFGYMAYLYFQTKSTEV
jgi:hypothetical protein